MSYDLILFEGEEEIASINWIRNPFGLQRWACDNVHIETEIGLWEVCNKWSYKESNNIDRALFKRVVNAYNEVIQSMTEGWFWFDKDTWNQTKNQFASGNYPAPTWWNRDCSHPMEWEHRGRIRIPMNMFEHNGQMNLTDYKSWFSELVHIADLMQDPEVEVYISN